MKLITIVKIIYIYMDERNDELNTMGEFVFIKFITQPP